MNDIDPGVILAPGGTLWICFGSYQGSINLLQLDPKTGLAPASHGGTQGITIAAESEAADIISHDGYFYLFVNHGSCCKGKDSEYNIRVGRSRTITGPYLDNMESRLLEAEVLSFLRRTITALALDTLAA